MRFFRLSYYANMKIYLALLSLSVMSLSSWGQFNDTLYYESGMKKIVEIDSFNVFWIKYSYRNTRSKFVESKVGMGQISHFIILDSTNKVILDSQKEYPKGKPKSSSRNLELPQHTLSVNPILLFFASPNTRYNYVFGNKMQWALNVRLSFISTLFPLYDIGTWGGIFAGAGMKFIPYYSQRFSFGFDITPVFLLIPGSCCDLSFLVPLSANFDWYFGKRFGLTWDIGWGYAYDDGYVGLLGRIHLGLLYRFNKSKIIDRPLIGK